MVRKECAALETLLESHPRRNEVDSLLRGPSLEAENLQTVAQDRFDPQTIVATQNELRSSTHCPPKPNFFTLRSGRRCGRFCPEPELLFKLSMMLRHTEYLFESQIESRGALGSAPSCNSEPCCKASQILHFSKNRPFFRET